jgi:dipeptidyl-peptidase 4
MSLITRPMFRIMAPVLAVSFVIALAAFPSVAQEQEPRTEAELSGFTSYTSYDYMMGYLRDVQAASTEMKLDSYGETYEGRELPYAIFSRPAVSQPWEAAALGKPVVLLAAGVHGGERTLRESLLILIRELSQPGTEANRLLDDMVILVAPMINPDGFEATARGQRGNAWGIDLNRDYIKLEQPAILHYVRDLVHRWSPHLYIDGHNGGSFPYNLNYQCTSNAGADRRITLLCDQELFPAIDARLEAEDFKSWYYTRGTETRWNGGGSEARIGRNYGGMANMVAILFESPGWQEMRIGVPSGILGYKAIVEWVRDNPERLVRTVNDARRETIALGSAAEGDVVVEMEYAPEEYTVTYEIGTGNGPEVRTITSDSLMIRPVATKVRPRPYAYLLPRDAVDAVALLRRHNITVEVLQEDMTLQADAYRIDGVDFERAYNHAAAAKVRVADVVSLEQTFPRGTYVIPTGQMMGRVVTHMLEPETSDNIVYWNTMDAWIPRSFGEEDVILPIFKVMRPIPLSTRMLREGGR